MNGLAHPPCLSVRQSRSFALVAVLALVSLAALTATAFLASSRLERTATRSIGSSTHLDMALYAGMECASQAINEGIQPDVGGNTHIITYWRGAWWGTNTNEWTNELGYPLIGKIKTSGNAGSNSATWYYFTLFSPPGLTNLDTNDIVDLVRVTNSHQGTFSNDLASKWRIWTTLAGTNWNEIAANNPDTTNAKATVIPLLGGRTSPAVSWVYIQQEKRPIGTTNTNLVTSPVVRMAWFTEDLEGLIDAERMGGSNRNTGTNAAEISLTNLTDTNGSRILTNLTAFTNNRALYLTPGLLGNSSLSGIKTNDVRYFASGLRSWSPTSAVGTNGALAWIPVGIPIGGSANTPLGYSNQGYTKVNLNWLLNTNNINSSTQKVSILSEILQTNLPRFTNRAGAMNGLAYLSNVAANIVDYVDTDTNPSVDTANAIPTWRGVEPIAWPNEVFTRFGLTNRTPIARGFRFQLDIKQYVELWNLNSTPITVNASDYSMTMNLDMIATTPGGGSSVNLNTLYTPTALSFTNAPFDLPPNSYGVISTDTTPAQISIITTETGTPLLRLVAPTVTNNISNQRYNISYRGRVVDATRAGRWLDTRATNLQVGGWHFIVTPGNLGTSADSLQFNLACGDPRGGLFVNQPFMDFQYTWSTPGGRNVDNNSQTRGLAKYVDPALNWPDFGHSLGNSGADIVTPPVSATANNSIGQGIQRQGNPNHWIQKVNGTGAFTNITELGNIFDPIQWGDPQNPFFSRDTAAWMGLSNTATPFGGACGRTSLRIGRPEHQLFAFTNMFGGNPNTNIPIPNMGMSSAALLDLFCLTNTTNGSVGGPFETGGKINLNTAPAPVLRALAGGIVLSNDLAQVPRNAVISPAMAEAFAQGVMRFRAKYPFLTPSHLCFIGTDPGWPNTNTWPSNAVFGNTNPTTWRARLSVAPGNVYGNNASLNITEWNDQANEEWFSKIYALSSCQSYNFRVYVMAQLVATNAKGEIIPLGAPAKKYFHLFAQNGSSVTRPDTSPRNTTRRGTNSYGPVQIYTWTPAMGIYKISETRY